MAYHGYAQHLEGSRKYARCLFIDFSSAFNTIQPHVLIQKLLKYENINKNLIGWILNFLTKRSQYVKLNKTFSNLIFLSTGAPQGCVLSPTLYTMYTNDFRITNADTKILKFADDTSIQGLMSLSDNSYFLNIQRFVEWCHANFLTLNVSKTKKIIIDFRLLKEIPPPVIINEQSVEIVDKYKYLGLVIDFKLNWNEHVNILIKRLNQRLYFLRRLRSFNFSSNSLKMFYLSIIESIICFGISCWGNSITSNDKNRINKIIKKAAKITNNELCCFQELYQKCCYKKFKIICEDPTHPIYPSFIRSSRSGRFLQPAARTERYGNSFVCSSVRISRELTAPR